MRKYINGKAHYTPCLLYTSPPDNEKQPDRSEQPPAYDLAEDDEIGMVECTVESIRGL